MSMECCWDEFKSTGAPGGLVREPVWKGVASSPESGCMRHPARLCL